ncbi:MAG: phage holin family protein [Nitrolancea sp.]
MSEQISSKGGGYEQAWQGGDRASFGELIQDIVTNIQGLIRSEFRLAKTEIREDAAAAGKAVAVLVAGVALAFYGVGFLLLTAVYALNIVFSTWLAALIVGAGVMVFAAILVGIGYGKLKSINPAPEQTVDTVKEDVAWVRQEVKRGK